MSDIQVKVDDCAMCPMLEAPGMGLFQAMRCQLGPKPALCSFDGPEYREQPPDDCPLRSSKVVVTLDESVI
jgi:hypothetical protein